jgi:hypothetical protein
MNIQPIKLLLFLAIFFLVKSLDAQKIDSVYRGKSFPGVLFDNPYANQKFIGTWVIKGWDGKHELKDSSYIVYSGPAIDPSVDSVCSVKMVIPKYQDSLVLLDISNEDYSKNITIPGCSDCSFISYYDLRNDILYANNPANKNQTLIITRNPNGDYLNVTLGYYINDTIYKEKSYVLEEMYKYTRGSLKMKLPKETKKLKLKDIDKLEFELQTGKVYGDSILSNKEYKISIFELGTNVGGLYKTSVGNYSLSDLKLAILPFRTNGTIQKYYIEAKVKTSIANIEKTYWLSFKLNEKDEIILE